VDGSNSDICGDYIVDTPADPNIKYRVDENCNFTKDIFEYGTGLLYEPSTTNIMSYTKPDCMEEFTIGQGARIRTLIYTNPVLSNVVSELSSAVTLTQVLSNGNEADSIAFYETSDFVNYASGTILYNVPFDEYKVFKATTKTISNNNNVEKFYNWPLHDFYLNHSSFFIDN